MNWLGALLLALLSVLPHPFMFLSNEADVLREIRAVAATLTGR